MLYSKIEFTMCSAKQESLLFTLGGSQSRNLDDPLSTVVEVYQMKKNAWSLFEPLQVIRARQACICLSTDTLYVLGGYHLKGRSFKYNSEI